MMKNGLHIVAPQTAPLAEEKGWSGLYAHICELALAEAYERYRLQIHKDGAVVRETETQTSEYLYAAADIAADFGPDGPGGSLVFCVAQLSDAVGDGAEAEASCNIE